jgi:hypothetical protein
MRASGQPLTLSGISMFLFFPLSSAEGLPRSVCHSGCAGGDCTLRCREMARHNPPIAGGLVPETDLRMQCRCIRSLIASKGSLRSSYPSTMPRLARLSQPGESWQRIPPTLPSGKGFAPYGDLPSPFEGSGKGSLASTTRTVLSLSKTILARLSIVLWLCLYNNKPTSTV